MLCHFYAVEREILLDTRSVDDDDSDENAPKGGLGTNTMRLDELITQGHER